MYDTNLMFYSAKTSGSASDTDGTGLDLGKTPAGGLWAELVITAVSGSVGTLAAKIQESDDNNTFNDLVAFETLASLEEARRDYASVENKQSEEGGSVYRRLKVAGYFQAAIRLELENN